MRQFPHAAKGLRFIFYGYAMSVLGAFLAFTFPLYLLVSILANVLCAVGLFVARRDGVGYRNGLYALLIQMLASIITIAPLDILITSVAQVMSVVVVYLICKTTSNLLIQEGASQLAQRGNQVWKLYLVLSVASLVSMMLLMVTNGSFLAIAFGAMSGIGGIVGYILLLQFMHQSSKVL